MENYSDVALKSARTLYKYLRDYKLGQSFANVTAKKRVAIGDAVYYYLTVPGINKVEDDIAIQIYETTYYQPSIKLTSWNERAHVLSVIPADELLPLFDNVPTNEIRIVSDMKFIVQRVGEWYKQYGDRIALPNCVPRLSPPNACDFIDPPSNEQYDAIKTILSNSLSYVWGAPGTGKTKYVLAYSLLQYIKARDSSHKIIVAAPTNNAVDQTLIGVLKVLEDFDISTDSVLRLGTPTYQLASSYPSVCEYGNIDMKLAECKTDYELVISTIKAISNNNNVRKAYEVFKDIVEEVVKIRNLRKKIFLDLKAKKSENDYLIKEYCFATDNADKAKKEFREFSELINSKKMKPIFFFSKKKRDEAVRRYYELEQEASDALQRQKIANDITVQCRKEISDLENRLGNCPTDEKLIDMILSVSYYDRSFVEKLLYFVMNSESDNFEEFCKSLLVEIPVGRYADLSLEDLLKELDLIQEQIKLLENYQNKFNSAKIIAATLDTLVSRYSLFFDEHKKSIVKHVFIDEAAYCPIIKAAISFSFNAPVTMLGDHMQLPPICEANDSKLTDEVKKLMVLWRKSGIFTEQIFDFDIGDIYSSYIQNNEYKLNHTVQRSLNHTYRFGESLANVLADNVYTKKFVGNINKGTEIVVLNVKKKHSNKQRENEAEADCIKNYLNECEEDYCILTPYTKQVKLLKRIIPDAARQDRIMTIHSSQGREWETVIISVVDVTNMWFTDSTNPQTDGLKILNTAISRAIHRLVICCDADFWITQKNQLLCRVIEHADHFVDVNKMHLSQKNAR